MSLVLLVYQCRRYQYQYQYQYNIRLLDVEASVYAVLVSVSASVQFEYKRKHRYTRHWHQCPAGPTLIPMPRILMQGSTPISVDCNLAGPIDANRRRSNRRQYDVLVVLTKTYTDAGVDTDHQIARSIWPVKTPWPSWPALSCVENAGLETDERRFHKESVCVLQGRLDRPAGAGRSRLSILSVVLVLSALQYQQYRL